jgi:hypothetical protein
MITRYCVFQKGPDWLVDLVGSHLDSLRFANKVTAIRHARFMGFADRPSVVQVVADDHAVTEEWTYEHAA